MTTRLERIENICNCLRNNNSEISILEMKMLEIADEIKLRSEINEFYIGRIIALSNVEIEPAETYDKDEDDYKFAYCNPDRKFRVRTEVMAQVIDKEIGTEVFKFEITAGIVEYINKNNLTNKMDRNYAKADEKLSALLRCNVGNNILIHNLHTYF